MSLLIRFSEVDVHSGCLGDLVYLWVVFWHVLRVQEVAVRAQTEAYGGVCKVHLYQRWIIVEPAGR